MKIISNIYDLTENKLIILFVLENINIPVTSAQLTEVIMKDSLMNYFILQQYLADLVNSKQIKRVEINNNNEFYEITRKGSQALKFFNGRIQCKKREKLLNAISEIRPEIKKSTEVISDYTPVNANCFVVECKIVENGFSLIDIKIATGSKADAKQMCESWNKDPQKIYTDIIASFTKQ